MRSISSWNKLSIKSTDLLVKKIRTVLIEDIKMLEHRRYDKRKTANPSRNSIGIKIASSEKRT